MKTTDFQTLGDRMKGYESLTTQTKLMPKLPVVARLDGKAFHTFTKGLKRPYDKRLSDLMVETTKFLVSETNANCGYTQSDEITLVWYFENDKTQMSYGGKLFKLQSDLSALCTLFFNKRLEEFLPEKKEQMPRFDCRVWNVPTLDEAVNCFLWRENDATRNSISMAAQSEFSHTQLQGKNRSQMQDMLMLDRNINWNDYPAFFKRGTYVQKSRKMIKFSTEELERLPKRHAARKNPDLMIERNVVEIKPLPPMSKIDNKVDVILFGKDVIKKSEV